MGEPRVTHLQYSYSISLNRFNPLESFRRLQILNTLFKPFLLFKTHNINCDLVMVWNCHLSRLSGGRRGRDRMVVGFTTTRAISACIITKVTSSNPVHGEVYSIQH